MMEKKVLLKLLVVFLCLSIVVHAAAVPATRFLMARKVDLLVLDHQAKEEMFDMKEGIDEERRMMMNIEDYPRTGPNHGHDPKSPGKP